MINHCVQFDRKPSGADIVSAPVEAAPATVLDQDPMNPVLDAAPPVQQSSMAVEKLLAEISQGIASLHSRHSEIAGELQIFSVRLAIKVVEKIIGNAESIQTQRLEHLLAEAIAKSEPAVCIYLNPADQPKLESCLETISSTHRELNVLTDEALEAGECRVDFGSYDLTSNLVQQVDEMEHRLLEVISHD